MVSVQVWTFQQREFTVPLMDEREVREQISAFLSRDLRCESLMGEYCKTWAVSQPFTAQYIWKLL